VTRLLNGDEIFPAQLTAIRSARVTLLGVEWHAIALLFLASGSLMMSTTLRIPKP
jgi:hypothetical protein